MVHIYLFYLCILITIAATYSTYLHQAPWAELYHELQQLACTRACLIVLSKNYLLKQPRGISGTLLRNDWHSITQHAIFWHDPVHAVLIPLSEWERHNHSCRTQHSAQVFSQLQTAYIDFSGTWRVKSNPAFLQGKQKYWELHLFSSSGRNSLEQIINRCLWSKSNHACPLHAGHH